MLKSSLQNIELIVKLVFSINRVFVNYKIYDKLLSLLVEHIKNLKVGNGFEKDLKLEPLISAQAVAIR
ncbi:MAG: aldehyde dehydrogenase family protein [Rickettsiales endosymbiont of Dermacentor nuttalli]